ncbi:MAG TPA: mucoidy inhibitor MuiA family protein, partial [Opitutaceae bacterium]|nr:mucoidy inhibitor MuiA family protein [Opitutaceae bacterium]
FVATSPMKTIMPREKFDLAFGADDGISVKRRLVNRFAEETGLTSKGRRVTYEFLVTLANNKKTAERVVFKEAVPLSRDEKIVVKLLTPVERDIGAADSLKEITRDEEGRLVWRVNLKAGEKREFPMKVSIDYPSEITVSGLD